jgi:hypothetical protein
MKVILNGFYGGLYLKESYLEKNDEQKEPKVEVNLCPGLAKQVLLDVDNCFVGTEDRMAVFERAPAICAIRALAF